MLLGPNKHTSLRQKIKKELNEKGYKKIVIMENEKDGEDEIGLDEKFERIIKEHKPELFIALFHKKTKMNAVIFEVGWICGKYGPKKVGSKIRFLHDEKFDLARTTAYIETLLPRTTCIPFNEKLPFTKASTLIHKFVLQIAHD